jgi:hypothetical protein
VTSPVIVQPDLEAWVWENIRDLKGVTSFGYAAAQLDHTGWIMQHFIQVDARHVDKQASRDLAEQVRQVITGLADLPWPQGVICYIQPVEGPAWLPDDDGAPRYMARYEIRVHPPRRATVPAGT